MVELSIDSGRLHCEVLGFHKFLAVKSSLDIPLEHIRSVEAKPEEAKSWWHGWKILGTDLPGVMASGLFRVKGKWVFWDVSTPENTIEIQLIDETYDRILIEVRDPQVAIETIRSAIGAAEV